jgi:hypothetical protein
MRKKGLVESDVAGGAVGAGVFSILRKGFVPVLLAEGDPTGSLGAGGLEIGKLSLGGVDIL